MAINLKEVERIAKLARLGLSAEEKEVLKNELSSILDWVDKLQEVDTKDVEPIAQITGLVNITRADEIDQFADQGDILDQAPGRDKDYIKVKKVFDN